MMFDARTRKGYSERDTEFIGTLHRMNRKRRMFLICQPGQHSHFPLMRDRDFARVARKTKTQRLEIGLFTRPANEERVNACFARQVFKGGNLSGRKNGSRYGKYINLRIDALDVNANSSSLTI